MANKAPKQWDLTSNETLNSFKNWKENLVYTLSLDKSFAPFLKDGVTWGKQTSINATRGFADDGDNVPERKTKEEKCASLNLMLGQIANYATIISRNSIIKGSTSLNDIWEQIRLHYGFQTTGSRFLDLSSVRQLPGERPEDLYQRIVSFIDDNLLTTDGSLTHHSVAVTMDEEISPSLENVVVLLWLERLHIGLPALVKQRYGSELRNKTLASIKPEISQALTSLVEELSIGEDSWVCRTQSYNHQSSSRQSRSQSSRNSQQGGKYCCLCRTANRPNFQDHYLSQCRYLPESDRRHYSNIRNVEVLDLDGQEDFHENEAVIQYGGSGGASQNQYGVGASYGNGNGATNVVNNNNIGDENNNSNNLFLDPPPSILRRVSTRKSPRMQCFFAHFPVCLLLDSGAESNLMGERTCTLMGISYSKTNQGAQQVDMKTPLPIVGEISGIRITKGAHVFVLDALITKDDIGDVVAGEPFLERNDVALRPAKRQIIIKGREIISYESL